ALPPIRRLRLRAAGLSQCGKSARLPLDPAPARHGLSRVHRLPVPDRGRGGRHMIAVVTGASAGIGRATAREFAAHGWDVAVLARDRARLETAAAEIRNRGVRALPIVTDVADFAAVEPLPFASNKNSVRSMS